MSAVPSRTKMGQWRIFGKLKSWTCNFKSINPELSFVVKRIAAKSSSPAPGLVVCGVFFVFLVLWKLYERRAGIYSIVS